VKSQTEQSHKERILRVLVYIQQNLDGTIELDDLARVAHFSPYYFHRLFRGMVGESVMEHVRRLRLERAAQRLKLSDEPVTQVAFEAGYETHEAFSRAFRAMFDESPTQFREGRRALRFRTVPSNVHFAADGTVEDFQTNQDGLAMDVRVVQVPTMRVAFMRHVGPFDQVGMTWGKLMSWAGCQGLLRGRPRILGIVHDDPEVTAPEKLRYDACLVVDTDFRSTGEIGVQEAGGSEFAVTEHRGPYSQLAETYVRLLGHWLPGSAREPKSAPAFEMYLNSPMDTAPPDLLTEIYLPLAEL
jgi:AraC family transcriptional regulator